MLALIDSEWGLVLVFAAILLMFGSTKLPKLARSIGSAQKEFHAGQAEGHVKAEPEEIESAKATPAEITATSSSGQLTQ